MYIYAEFVRSDNSRRNASRSKGEIPCASKDGKTRFNILGRCSKTLKKNKNANSTYQLDCYMWCLIILWSVQTPAQMRINMKKKELDAHISIENLLETCRKFLGVTKRF
ncbi:hypothetical protein POVCU2_0036190 [Plasmodium ovale curtisi]|uniref:Uncharacterized protein n=1 Tax=Plasmodium ovale curtisi TaxID=864141 RepID=A0A1A8WUT6_PLAOA|nr:hypothetical protein POVCU2_0036190 [Plasmodium ovale curtisi]SBS96690.1 hypothetical protein POVCU1_033470 [Plasmodium ovale curtisi]